MPDMTEHESHDIVKMLYVGDSGGGKTGSLASLVDAGLNLRVLDFDNGLSVLKGYVKDKTKLKNVTYLTLRDELNLVAGRMVIKKASAYQRAINALQKGGAEWGAGITIPPFGEWGANDVLVIDSLSALGKSSLKMVMAANAAMDKNPELQHYGVAMDNIEKLLDMVTSDAVKCHVIVITHLTTVEGSLKIYPEALGSKLGPKIAKPFDNMISVSITGGERTIKTSKDGLLALKTATPLDPSYPIATGMVSIFKKLTGKTDLVSKSAVDGPPQAEASTG